MGSGDDRPLVSVIVPAYNAARWLGFTLDSALRQSHRNLEVIVVNDGSTDETEAVAAEFARRDSRLQVISTPNRGVAAARNTGIGEARSEFVAPLDADDLWHAEKIARQLDALERGGPEMGFVYAGYRIIDADGKVVSSPPLKICEGRVFLRSIFSNLVGNGSGLLVRRQALLQCGGYSGEFRRRGLEGSEDRLVQTLIARHWTVGAVPAYLVGYRHLPNAMSANRVRMHRARLAMLSMVADVYPDVPRWVLDAAIASVEINLAFSRRKARSDPISMSAYLYQALRHSPETAARELYARLRGAAARRALRLGAPIWIAPAQIGAGQDFLALSPDDGADPGMRHPHAWMLDRLAREEETFIAHATKRACGGTGTVGTG